MGKLNSLINSSKYEALESEYNHKTLTLLTRLKNGDITTSQFLAFERQASKEYLDGQINLENEFIQRFESAENLLNAALEDLKELSLDDFLQFYPKQYRLSKEQCMTFISARLCIYLNEFSKKPEQWDFFTAEIDKQIDFIFEELKRRTVNSQGKLEKINIPNDKISFKVFHEKAAETELQKDKCLDFYNIPFSKTIKEVIPTSISYRLNSEKVGAYEFRLLAIIGTRFKNAHLPPGIPLNISLSQLCKDMGIHSKPTINQITRLYQAIELCRNTSLTVLDDIEQILYPGKNSLKIKDRKLLDADVLGILSADGSREVTGIQVIRMPAICTLSASKNQLIAVDCSLYSLPLTNFNMSIEDFLIRYIKGLKSEKSNLASASLTYESIFKNLSSLDFSERMTKARARKKIKTVLNHLREIGFIGGYKEVSDGIKVML